MLFAFLEEHSPHSNCRNTQRTIAGEARSRVSFADLFLKSPLGYNSLSLRVDKRRMPSRASHGRGLRLIAAFKLLKGFALLVVGIGAIRLLHKDVAAIVEHWINVFEVDPHNHYIHLLLGKLSILDDRRLKELSAGTFIYAAIFFTEGIGLALHKRWAEYFTIITTSSFLPLEIYELIKHFGLGKVFALLINIAVVVYLVFELRRYPRKRS